MIFTFVHIDLGEGGMRRNYKKTFLIRDLSVKSCEIIVYLLSKLGMYKLAICYGENILKNNRLSKPIKSSLLMSMAICFYKLHKNVEAGRYFESADIILKTQDDVRCKILSRAKYNQKRYKRLSALSCGFGC